VPQCDNETDKSLTNAIECRQAVAYKKNEPISAT
jgi:hypothetical protein